MQYLVSMGDAVIARGVTKHATYHEQAERLARRALCLSHV
jgi:hypothetical protein